MIARGAEQYSGGTERTAQDNMLGIICSEFREMPGMHLTRAQFKRLWDLTEAECQRLLEQLVGSGFLAESHHGQFGRPADV